MGLELIILLMLFKICIGSFTIQTNSMNPILVPNDKFIGNMIIYNFEKPSRGDIIVFKEPFENKVFYTKRIIGLPGEKVKIGENGEIYINGNAIVNKKINAKYVRKGFMADKEWVIPKKGDTIEVIGGHAILNDESIQNIDMESFKQIMGKNNKKQSDAIAYVRFLLNGNYETGPILDFKYNEELVTKLFNGEKVVLDSDYYFVLGDNSNKSFDSRYWGFVEEDRIKGKVTNIIYPKERAGEVE